MRTGWEIGKKGHVKLTLSDFEIKNAGMVKSLGCSEVNVVHAAIVSIRYQLWSTGSLVGRHLSQGIRRLTELSGGLRKQSSLSLQEQPLAPLLGTALLE